jgi:hypothetical protein
LTEHNQGVGRISATADISPATAYFIIFIRVAIDKVNDVECCITNAQ